MTVGFDVGGLTFGFEFAFKLCSDRSFVFSFNIGVVLRLKVRMSPGRRTRWTDTNERRYKWARDLQRVVT